MNVGWREAAADLSVLNDSHVRDWLFERELIIELTATQHIEPRRTGPQAHALSRAHEATEQEEHCGEHPERARGKPELQAEGKDSEQKRELGKRNVRCSSESRTNAAGAERRGGAGD
eukprot:scaffold13039_cov36-Tisochrysis_lutea.AAC.3